MRCFTIRAPAVQALLLLFSIVASAGERVSTTTITKTVAYNTYTTTTSRTDKCCSKTEFAETRPSHAASSIPAMHGHGSYSSAKLQSSVLNSTNHYRALYLARPLSWDSKLAGYAQRHAQKCIWEHSGGPYGENLALNYQTPTLGIDAWAAEEKKYVYPDEGFSEETGHWTQLVWQNTTRVGCAATNCNSNAADGAKGWFLVCEYHPPGNVEGQYVWNVQKPGESDDGKLGFGAPSIAPTEERSRLLTALVAVALLAGMWL